MGRFTTKKDPRPLIWTERWLVKNGRADTDQASENGRILGNSLEKEKNFCSEWQDKGLISSNFEYPLGVASKIFVSVETRVHDEIGLNCAIDGKIYVSSKLVYAIGYVAFPPVLKGEI